MDQVKQVLAVLKKQHFWVLSAILIIVGLGAWHFAVAKLAGQYQERETKLSSQRKAVQEVTKSTDPPNQSVIEAIGEAHKGLKDEVYRAWTFLYQVQKENNPWPQVLSVGFIKAAEALKPGENYLKAGEQFKEDKHPEEYQNFMREYLPRLGVIVDVREPKSVREERLKPKAARRPLVKKKIEKKKPADSAGAAEKKAAAEEIAEEELVGRVAWDENNELMIRQQFEWEMRPTTLQVLVAQENLWVYEALLRIIRDTNEGSTSYYKAPVKQILSLEIGREAAGALAGGRGSGGMGSGMPGMYGGMGGPGSMPGAGGMGMSMTSPGAAMMPGGDATSPGTSGAPGGADASAGPQEMMARALLDGRYVDQKGQPLAYGTDPPFPQFKMMPVRMLLLVDQKRIPRLLAQCANSSMPVEVKRVILRPDQVQGLNLGSPSGSGSASGMPGMPGMPSAGRSMGSMGGGSADAVSGGSMPGAMPGMKAGGMSASTMMKSPARGSGSSGSMPGVGGGMPGTASGAGEESPWDMKVEIQGIIYIFNPPDRSKFDIAESAAPATPAAPAPGPTPAPAGTPKGSGDTAPAAVPGTEATAVPRK